MSTKYDLSKVDGYYPVELTIKCRGGETSYIIDDETIDGLIEDFILRRGDNDGNQFGADVPIIPDEMIEIFGMLVFDLIENIQPTKTEENHV